MSADALTENDARIIARFRVDLSAMAALKREGHSHLCAMNQVGGDDVVARCVCEKGPRP